MRVKGVILCGGEGKRLRPLTYYFQKTMIPIGKRQKPLLEYIVRLFRYYGYRDLVFLVGYKYEQIRNYFGDGSRFDVNIEYVVDPSGKKGSGHSLLNAYKKDVFLDTDALLIYYGDILSNINLNELLEFHRSREASITLAVSERYQVPVGVVEAEGDKVLGMVEKPWINLYATIGVLVVNTNTLDILRDQEDMLELDIMSHFIPQALKYFDIYMYRFNGFWYDVGSTEKYEKLDNHIIEELFKDILVQE